MAAVGTDSGEIWWLWLDGERAPEENMEIDRSLLAAMPRLGRPVLRIYGWDRPAASVGYSQSPEVAAVPDGWTVVRRPTGGGVVWHDHDLTYTVATPAEHHINKLERTKSYHAIHRALLRALTEFGARATLSTDSANGVDRRTMRCFATPTRYDVLLADSGLKIAGAAQRRTRDGLLHQGSVALERLPGVSREKLAQALVAGFTAEFAARFSPWPYPEFP